VDMHPLPPLRDRERKGRRKILNDIMDRVGGFLIKKCPIYINYYRKIFNNNKKKYMKYRE